MQLTPLQTDLIRQHLQHAALQNGNLRTELLDHICCQIESEMASGKDFATAQSEILTQYDIPQLLHLEKQVHRAVHKPNVMQQMFLLAALLGGLFFTSYLVSPSHTDIADVSVEATPAVPDRVTQFNFPPLPPKASPLPLQYSITSSYGERVHPIYKKRQLHSGTDLKAPLGTPVLSAGDGTIRFARDSSAWGLLVIIEHDSIFTSQYAHLHTIDVVEGSFVYAGEQIGTVGNTGKSTAPHLHYEIHQNGIAIDPEIYLPKP